MKIEPFVLERLQSTWENKVQYNLTESGIHPYSLKELFSDKEIEEIISTRLGYCPTNGSEELREVISHLYPDTDKDNVLVTNGSAESNFLTIWSMLNPDDEIIFMLPNYMQMWGIARSFGIHVKPFYLKEELHWTPDLDEIKETISSKTQMIVVCNPNNPTGAVLTEEMMEEITRIAKDVNAWIYSDEIYKGAELNGKETSSFWNKFDYDKVIVNGGLSKAYALPGLRIGWMVGPKNIIEQAWAGHDYTTIAAGSISNQIATAVLKPQMREKVLQRNRKILNENLLILKKWIKKHKNLFYFIPPSAGGISFIRYNMDLNSTELSTKLRKEKSVFIVPGDCFGMDHFIRLGFGSEKDCFDKSLNLISDFLEDIRKKLF